MQIVVSKPAVSPRLQRAMDNLFGHVISSSGDDEEGEEDAEEKGTGEEEDSQDLKGIKVAEAIQLVLQSDDERGGVIGTCPATPSSSADSVPAYGFRATRGNTMERVRRGSVAPFISLYVDELPTAYAYIALFFQRSEVMVRLNRGTKVFRAVEMYSIRQDSHNLEQYDECLTKLSRDDMVYPVECICMEEIGLSHVDQDDTVEIWYEMSASTQGVHMRVAAKYTRQEATLVAIEIRPMVDVDTVLAYRSFESGTARPRQLPTIFLNPQLFVNDSPRISTCMPISSKNRAASCVWAALRKEAATDWKKYVKCRDDFVNGYRSIVDRNSKVQADPTA